ncbi:MAG: helix-turn-helix domain-containing protein [Fimbriimonadaceae bacterium]|nr:helix-turn-helix domain-containing protein [Fimbriimonadaceae bacterium]QYK56146.1 MAG: helix-turn-helix domain-containing protein [Fimbriimonadaceae bacterium]
MEGVATVTTKLTAGEFVRERRLAAGLSLSELARRSEVAKSTLSRWEAGKVEPDVAPLELVLDALGTGPAEKLRVFGALRAPRGTRAVKEFDQEDGKFFDQIGVSAPAFGSALRALRGRSGLSAQELADRLGVARSTFGLWETGDRVPSQESLDRLATLCGATPEERASLRGRSLTVTSAEPGRDGLAEWLQALVETLARNRTVNEVEAAGFEAEAWRLAQHDDFAAALLGQYYNVRAGDLCESFRVEEVRRYALKARDLPFWEAPKLVSHLPEACLAWVQYGTGGIDRMARAIRRLEECFARPMTWYETWSLHLFLAKFYAEQGRVAEMEAALGAATDLAAAKGAPEMQELTDSYLADCWDAAGFPERALRLLPGELPDVWAVPAHLETTRASALVRLGDEDGARRSLERVGSWIERNGIVTVEMRQVAARFEAQFAAPCSVPPGKEPPANAAIRPADIVDTQRGTETELVE